MMSRMNLVATLVAILAVVGTADQGNLRTRELVNTQEVSEHSAHHCHQFELTYLLCVHVEV